MYIVYIIVSMYMYDVGKYLLQVFIIIYMLYE